MQFIDVAVNTKTQKIDQVFTYSIPAKLLVDIKVGVLVEVPFRNRKLEGVIVAIKSRSPMGSGSRPEPTANRLSDQSIGGSVGTIKLKPINKILDRNPVLDPARLKLATWISNYYLAPIGETIFSMIPPIAYRLLSKQQISEFFAIAKNSDKQDVSKVYTLYDRIDGRVKDYIKLTKRVIQKKKQVIILFPEIAEKQAIFQKIEKEFGARNIAYLSGVLTKTERYQNWLDIRSGKKRVIIGSRSAIFAPVSDLGLIIIDEPEHFGYKEEQSPKYHSVTVAKKLAEISKAHLLLGSSFPSVENIYYEEKGQYKILKKLQAISYKLQVEIVDSNKDRGIISWKMEQEIGKMLKKNGKVVLFINRRGEGSSFVCNDCGYVSSCPRCELPLIPYLGKITNHKSQITNLICHKCNYRTNAPLSCPICKGSRFRTAGLGIDRVEKQVTKLFPHSKTLIIEKESVPTPLGQDPDRGIGADIIIGTKKILAYPNLEADLIGLIGIDNSLNLPDFHISENTLSTIVELIYRTKKLFLIQTFNPENEIIQFIAQKQFYQFLKKELEKRKQADYPPFSHLAKLVYQDKNEQKCQEEAERIAKLLELQVTGYKLQVLGPSPCFIGKKRDKFRYQIILKGKQNQINSILKLLTQNLSSWSIDVDPLDLL